jgi:DNA-binding MarR family transcriptional regulator
MSSSKQKNTDIADRLHSAAIRLLRMVRVQDSATGIGPARLSALSVLVFAGPMSLKSLAEKEQVRPPTMSRIVAGLEKDGLIKREILSADRREVRLHPTAKGTRILQQGRERRVEYLAGSLSKLHPKDLGTLKDAAEIIMRLSPPA